ncbi:MAG: TetR family transcriptional regulator, partial [Thermoanaerobaculum sp.]
MAPTVGEETRQRLVDVATELFARKGFADTTVRELAK